MPNYLTDADLGDAKTITPGAGDATPTAAAPNGPTYLTDDALGDAKTVTPGVRVDKPAPAPSIGRTAGLGARMALHGIGAVGGAFYDPFAIAANALGAKVPTMQNSADAWADLAGLPKPETGAERTADAIGTGTLGAAGFGGMTRTIASALERLSPRVARALTGSAETIAANPAANIGGAATGAAGAVAADDFAQQHGFSPLARAGLSTLGGLTAGLPGAMVSSKLANGLPTFTTRGILPGAAATDDQNATIDAARRAGIPLNAKDVGGANGWWGGLAKLASKAPFSNGIPRATAKAQDAGIRAALDQTAENYRPAGLGSTYQNVDQLVAADARSQYTQAKRNVSSAFDSVENALAANPGADRIQLPQTRDAAQRLVAQYPNVFDDLNMDTSGRRAVESILRGTGPTNSPIVQPNGQPFQRPPVITYQDARALSKSLGQMYEQAKRQAQSGTAGENQVRMIGDLYRALNGSGVPGGGGDIGAWAATAPGGAGRLHYQALDAFKDQVLPFRQDPQTYKLVSSRTPSTDYDLAAQGLFKQYFNAGQTERAPYLLSLLSPNGQNAVAYQALKSAADRATSPNSVGIGVGKGLRALDPDSSVLDAIAQHSPNMGADVRDMRALLNVGRNANETLSDPKTGNRLVGLTTGAGAYGLGAGLAHHAEANTLNTALAGVAGVVGLTGLGNLGALAGRYMPKSVAFASPGNLTTNAMGPLYGVHGGMTQPALPQPDDDLTGLGLLQ